MKKFFLYTFKVKFIFFINYIPIIASLVSGSDDFKRKKPPCDCCFIIDKIEDSENLELTSLSNLEDRSFQVYTLDVGKADCHIIKYLDVAGKWHVIMIDCGAMYRPCGFNTDPVEFLERIGVKQKKNKNKNQKIYSMEYIDIIIITHGHYDHYTKFGEILNNFFVKEVYTSYIGESTKFMDIMQKINFDESFVNPLKNAVKRKKTTWYKMSDESLGIQSSNIKKINQIPYKIKTDNNDLNIYILWPKTDKNSYPKQENNNSLVLLVKYKDTGFFFMGDLYVDAEEEFVKQYKHEDNIFKRIENIVLKVPHHGYNSSTSCGLLNFLGPDLSKDQENLEIKDTGQKRIAIVCTNVHWASPFINIHYSKSVLNRLKGKNYNVYSTHKNGNICVYFDNNEKNGPTICKVNLCQKSEEKMLPN